MIRNVWQWPIIVDLVRVPVSDTTLNEYNNFFTCRLLGKIHCSSSGILEFLGSGLDLNNGTTVSWVSKRGLLRPAPPSLRCSGPTYSLYTEGLERLRRRQRTTVKPFSRTRDRFPCRTEQFTPLPPHPPSWGYTSIEFQALLWRSVARDTIIRSLLAFQRSLSGGFSAAGWIILHLNFPKF